MSSEVSFLLASPLSQGAHMYSMQPSRDSYRATLKRFQKRYRSRLHRDSNTQEDISNLRAKLELLKELLK